MTSVRALGACHFCSDRRPERGASAVEYGLLIAGIAALIVLIIFAFSDTVIGLFDDTCQSIDGVTC